MPTLAEKIAVMQAAEAGAKIQYKSYYSNNEEWFDAAEPLWAWDNRVYRVRPEPREFWIDSSFNAHDCLSEALQYDKEKNLIHAREVPK